MKKVQLEVDNGNSDCSHTHPVANLNKIRMMERDDDSTQKPYKTSVAVAIIEEVGKNHA
jgi:hypothetical protein